MKWTTIKSIMVWFLIGMNILMLSIIAFTEKQRSSLPGEVISSSLSYLRKSGFDIDSELFPDKYQSLRSYSVQFYTASNLSEIFFGKQVAFRTKENSLVGADGKAMLTVNDNHFSYTDGYEAVTDASSGYKIKKALSKLGFDMTGAVYDKDENCFYMMESNTNLFNMFIKAKIDKDGEVCFVEAQWPKKLTPEERRKMSFIESLPEMKEAFPSGGKVDNIELGYSLRRSGNEKFVFYPGWRVTVDNVMKIID